jgi:hypothetical protein
MYVAGPPPGERLILEKRGLRAGLGRGWERAWIIQDNRVIFREGGLGLRGCGAVRGGNSRLKLGGPFSRLARLVRLVFENRAVSDLVSEK